MIFSFFYEKTTNPYIYIYENFILLVLPPTQAKTEITPLPFFSTLPFYLHNYNSFSHSQNIIEIEPNEI